MKALVVDGEWKPRRDYPVNAEEERRKRALIGSQVWRNPTFEIKDVPAPNIEEDEVLVRVVACGICGSDTHLYESDDEGYIIFSGLTKLPCVLGHEFSGIIEKAGRKVSSLQVGDKVAVESVMWCGTCDACRSGAPNQCRYLELMGLSTDGAFTEYVGVKEKYCWRINELGEVYSEAEIFEIGALVEPVGCAYNGMFIVGGGFKPGATVAVYGVGPIGLGAVALAKVAGASKIIAFDIIDERVELALTMGADHAYNLESLDGCFASDKVLKLTGGRGVDVQIEAAGAAPKVFPEMERSLSEQAKIIYLGRAATTTPVQLDALVSGASSITGARGHAGYGIFPFIIRLLARERFNLRLMIASRYPFEKIMEALKESTGRRGGKILIKM